MAITKINTGVTTVFQWTITESNIGRLKNKYPSIVGGPWFLKIQVFKQHGGFLVIEIQKRFTINRVVCIEIVVKGISGVEVYSVVAVSIKHIAAENILPVLHTRASVIHKNSIGVVAYVVSIENVVFVVPCVIRIEINTMARVVGDFIVVENKADYKKTKSKNIKISCETNEGIDLLVEELFSRYK